MAKAANKIVDNVPVPSTNQKYVFYMYISCTKFVTKIGQLLRFGNSERRARVPGKSTASLRFYPLLNLWKQVDYLRDWLNLDIQ